MLVATTDIRPRIATYKAPVDAPTTLRCWRFRIPDDLSVRAALYDVLAYLSSEDSWEASENVSVVDIASMFAAIIESSREEIPCEELSVIPIGSIFPYAGQDDLSPDWLLCQGQAVSREDYAALFAIIADTYGEGDGTTTFNVPDLRYRLPIGAGELHYDGTGVGVEAILGEQSGEHETYLNDLNIPPHAHTLPAQTAGGVSTANTFSRGTHLMVQISTSNFGSGLPFSNMPTVTTVNYIIKA